MPSFHLTEQVFFLFKNCYFHLIILDRVDHFIGDKSEAALLTEWFNVALLLNLGEDSDIGVDVYKGSDAGMRGLTLQFRFLVQSFSNVFVCFFVLL